MRPAKSVALRGIRSGLRLPQAPIDRLNELGFLLDLLKQLEVNLVLDVGANRGQFASELRGIGYEGRIVSFEPVASEFFHLQKSFRNDRKWTGYQMALGSKVESMAINVPRLTVMSSLLEAMTAEPDMRKETIAVQRLDAILPSLLQANGEVPRIFLKMDTQGYDLRVFDGAAGCIDLVLGIQSELSVQALYKNMPHYLEALAVYEKAGFDLYNLSVVNRTARGGLLELNCFMRRPSGN